MGRGRVSFRHTPPLPSGSLSPLALPASWRYAPSFRDCHWGSLTVGPPGRGGGGGGGPPPGTAGRAAPARPGGCPPWGGAARGDGPPPGTRGRARRGGDRAEAGRLGADERPVG